MDRPNQPTYTWVLTKEEGAAIWRALTAWGSKKRKGIPSLAKRAKLAELKGDLGHAAALEDILGEQQSDLEISQRLIDEYNSIFSHNQ